MTFEYLGEKAIEIHFKVAQLGLASIAPKNKGSYQPSVDVLCADMERFLASLTEDPSTDPDDPIIPKMMSSLYGFCFVWASEYRWAKNPLGYSYAADVVVSPDEKYYLCPLDIIVSQMGEFPPGLKGLILDVFHGKLPAPSSRDAIQIPID